MPSLALAKSRVLANVAGLTTTFFDIVREEMFGSGEQGIYMPSVHESFLRGDLYRDGTGTIPVTAVGQPVGLWLDRSKGLALGVECYDDATVTLVGETIRVSAGSYSIVNPSVRSAVQITAGVVVGKLYKVTVRITRTSGAEGLKVEYGSGGTAVNLPNTVGVHTAHVVTDTVQGFQITRIASTTDVDFDSISVRELPGNHAHQSTAAAHPTFQQDANGMYVLRFDGVDDWMVTPSIDFTGTDKMTVLSGKHIADLGGAAGYPMNFNITGFNSVTAYAPSASGQLGGAAAGNTALRFVVEASPGAGSLRAVYTFRHDLAVASDYYRNGLLKATSASSTGGGTFANAPIGVGARSDGAAGHFNGDIYGLIVCGAAKSIAQIEAAENLINRYTKAY